MTITTGTVKWFNNAKGYGFILSETNQEDIFAHYSAIEMDGYKSLKAGQQVSFEVQFGAKGIHATHIRPLAPELSTPPDTLDHSPTPPSARMPFGRVRSAAAGDPEILRQAHRTG